MRVLITGGCKNGKSSYAERLAIKLSKDKKRYYVATMVPYDEEDFDRIKRHREERKNLGFETIEINDDLSALKSIKNDEVILLDSLTALIYNYMTKEMGHNCENCENKCKYYNDSIKIYKNESNDDIVKVISKIIYDINENILDSDKNVVFVTDYIYSNSFCPNDYTKKYMHILSEICKYIAKISDIVLDIRYTIPEIYKGENLEIINSI